MKLTKENALDSFLAAISRIDSALESIQTASDDHFGVNPDAAGWEDSSQAQRVAIHLEKLLDIINQTGEYAA